MYYGNNVGIVPLTDAAGITQEFKKGEHYGVDIGWNKQHNCDVLAWQDGKVVATGYTWDCGYYVVLEHTYATRKRWTCYIHLASGSTIVSVGQSVKLGQKIAKRGNTGHSSGEHLHLYLTSEITKKLPFNWTNLKTYSINPVPYLYYSKEYNTIYISQNSWKKPLPDPIPEVVQPVDRDILKDQIICHEEGLRVRTGASISKTVIGHLLKDRFYNYLDTVDSDGYTWYKIANNQWCAGIDSLEVLPHIDIVQPVEKDSSKDQLICSISNLRVRTAASLKGTQIGFLKQNEYYDWFGKENADGYEWYKLAENQYCAKVDEVTILPKIEYYTAVEGDTLESIAVKFNTSVDKLVTLNPQLVEAGDEIRVQ